MVTKSGSRIIMPEQPTSLQFRDHTFNKDLEGMWEMCRQDHKSICSIGDKPFFQGKANGSIANLIILFESNVMPTFSIDGFNFFDILPRFAIMTTRIHCQCASNGAGNSR